ncbi:MAG: hypothetical protein EAZ53_02940 [Bacteroidetes bacterium]|nr:MAG: hypothetical protein EAZ53_02940 [Bacteroidota bacterium]
MRFIELNIELENEKNEFNSILNELYHNQEYIEKLKQINRYNLISVFILKKQEKVMSRVSLYSSIIKEEENIYLFGNFEALDIDSGVGILKYLHSKIKTKNSLATVIGPINGNSWFNYRIALNNFDLLFKNDITNPQYYREIFEKSGYKLAYHYLTNLQTSFVVTQSKIIPDYSIVYFNEEELNNRMIEIYDITMQAFYHAPFFSPIPFSVFENQFVKQLKIIDLNLSPFIINSKNELCAYSSCHLANNPEEIVVKTMARKNGRQYAGLGRMLSDEIVKKAKQINSSAIFHAFMHIENSSKCLSEKNKGITIKEYGLYQCEL